MYKNKYQVSKEAKELLLYSKCKELNNQDLIALLGDDNSLVRLSSAKELQRRGGELVKKLGIFLCEDASYKKRELGAFILGQLVSSKGDECIIFSLLKDLVKKDKSSIVRATALESMAHMYKKNDSFSDCLIKKAFITFSDRSVYVRRATAFALSCVKNEKTIPILITLCEDKSDLVKSWAAFAININEYTSGEISDQLFMMLDSKDPEIRKEAIEGLARVKDGRLVPVLKQELGQEIIYDDIIYAIQELGDQTFITILSSLLNKVDDDDKLIENTILALKNLN